jgi:hypothetical protein
VFCQKVARIRSLSILPAGDRGSSGHCSTAHSCIGSSSAMTRTRVLHQRLLADHGSVKDASAERTGATHGPP